MKICLIDPPGLTKGLNVGIGYLASSLIKEGHVVSAIDMNNDTNNIENRIESIKDYDLIGVSIKSFTVQSACELSKITGRKDLICGGPHITLDGYNFLQENPNFGIGVVGEGETTLVELVNAIENGLGLEDIKGIIYRDRNKIIVNPRRDFIGDLSSLSHPNYEVFDSFTGIIEKYPLITSRGCPYLCTYCSVRETSGKRWRPRAPDDVIKELQLSKSKYDTRIFSVLDDNFTQDISRAKKICQLLIERGLDMKWGCSNGIRADRVDEELVALMRDSGCESVSIGIESLDETVFNAIKKGEKLEEVKRAIRTLKKYKVKVEGFFMVGLPGDNLQRTKSSLQLSKKLDLDRALWNLFVPYPGTEAWQWVNENAKIIRDWKQGFHFGAKINPVFETEDFSEKERVYAFKLANVKSKGYSALYDEGRSLLFNAFKILGLILRHDIQNLPSHLLYVLNNLRRIYNRYGKGRRR